MGWWKGYGKWSEQSLEKTYSSVKTVLGFESIDGINRNREKL